MTWDIDSEHERAVEEFLEAARERDPGRVAEIERLFPVLTERELASRRAREVGFTEQCMETGVLSQGDGHRRSISLIADLFGRRIAIPQF